MNYKVHFLPQDISVQVPIGTTIMEAERIAGIAFDSPCGGNGTCGKCVVSLSTGELVKACQTKVTKDITVTLGEFQGESTVLLESSNENINLCRNQHITIEKITLPEAVIGDFESDFERFCNYFDSERRTRIGFASVTTLSTLSNLIAQDKFTFYAVFMGDLLLDVREENFTPLGLAFDIGTTTVACYLMDLETGATISSSGELNKQVKYGGDVVSRCLYATTESLDEIKNCINTQTDEMSAEIFKKNGKNPKDVYMISIVGNTCMHHIFAGISPVSLVSVPYTPSINKSMVLPAKQYIKNVNENARLLFLPVIAGFIGADTVGAILSTQFYKRESLTLLLDIGTNGEMALGNKDGWISCSTASGPAFEGAKITCGMRGAPGAIDHVFMNADKLEFTTIDDIAPVGICGSGIVDLIAVMLDEGIISKSGRFTRSTTKIDGINSYNLTEDIYITQKDIREVQLAKGAIQAGIKLMCEKKGVSPTDINEVLIAGAFGNYMKPSSMCKIGLIPPELESKIVPVGNAAGAGAKLCAIDKQSATEAESIATKTEFLELATHENFQNTFISSLDF